MRRIVAVAMAGGLIAIPELVSGQEPRVGGISSEESALIAVFQLRVISMRDSTLIDTCSLRSAMSPGAEFPHLLVRSLKGLFTVPDFASCGPAGEAATVDERREVVHVDSMNLGSRRGMVWLSVRRGSGRFEEHHFLAPSFEQPPPWRHDSVTVIHRPGVDIYPPWQTPPGAGVAERFSRRSLNAAVPQSALGGTPPPPTSRFRSANRWMSPATSASRSSAPAIRSSESRSTSRSATRVRGSGRRMDSSSAGESGSGIGR